MSVRMSFCQIKHSFANGCVIIWFQALINPLSTAIVLPLYWQYDGVTVERCCYDGVMVIILHI